MLNASGVEKTRFLVNTIFFTKLPRLCSQTAVGATTREEEKKPGEKVRGVVIIRRH